MSRTPAPIKRSRGDKRGGGRHGLSGRQGGAGHRIGPRHWRSGRAQARRRRCQSRGQRARSGCRRGNGGDDHGAWCRSWAMLPRRTSVRKRSPRRSRRCVVGWTATCLVELNQYWQREPCAELRRSLRAWRRNLSCLIPNQFRRRSDATTAANRSASSFTDIGGCVSAQSNVWTPISVASRE